MSNLEKIQKGMRVLQILSRMGALPCLREQNEVTNSGRHDMSTLKLQ